jgi:hypothetical protein
MERRLNCYNYIFGSCKLGTRCPYGHVVVKDRDEYLRQLEINELNTAGRTSPRAGNFTIRFPSSNNAESDSKESDAFYTNSCKIHNTRITLDDSMCIECARIKKFGDLYNL